MTRILRFTTFLAPSMFPVYEFITRHIGHRLGLATELTVGKCYEELADTDVSFVCGLAYIELCGAGRLPMVPIAAPVLAGPRSQGQPIYFSDVIVHRDSRFQTFSDLRGASWSFNECLSHSGYGITRYHLVKLGRTDGFFGPVIEAGFHDQSIRMVREGLVDASAIDCHVLALAYLQDPSLKQEVRIIDSLGPSTIQPVVAAERLSRDLRDQIRHVLVDLADDAHGRVWLARGLLERFVPVDEGAYDDLRRMVRACAAANFLMLR